MKKATIGARILLGLIFLVFGLNGFVRFIKQPPPTGLALAFLGALVASHEFAVVMILQIIAGSLLLANRFVPLALVILGPIIVNIALFHAFMDPGGLPVAVSTVILWLLAAYGVRSAFTGLLQVQTPASEEL